MPSKEQILAALPQVVGQLLKLPREAEPQPCNQNKGADVCFRVGPHVLVVEVKSSSRVAHVNQGINDLISSKASQAANAIPILAVPFMGDSGKQICSSRGVGFVDLSGNAHIEARGLLIHVEGRQNKYVARGRPASPFSPKASRVSRLLLRDPDRWWSQKELAQESQLGAGYISRLAKRLFEDGLIQRNEGQHIKPGDPGLLLDAWRNDYKFERHLSITGHVSSRTGSELSRRAGDVLSEAKIQYAVTGLSGAELLAPFAAYRRATIFVSTQPGEEVLERLKFRTEKTGANLWLVVPDDPSVFWDTHKVGDTCCASALQIYLDLKGMPERADEAAKYLRSEHLNWSRNA